jgi:hypothetical protein
VPRHPITVDAGSEDGMTDDLPFGEPLTAANPAAAKPKCRTHVWLNGTCIRCLHVRDEVKARRGKNNRSRGNAAELDVARTLGGRKMGPLGLPWDVEMPGYARLQVRKYLNPQSLRKIAAELTRIGSGPEMPGYVWLEPGRGGEQLIVFRLRDFSDRHGIPVGRDADDEIQPVDPYLESL